MNSRPWKWNQNRLSDILRYLWIREAWLWAVSWRLVRGCSSLNSGVVAFSLTILGLRSFRYAISGLWFLVKLLWYGCFGAAGYINIGLIWSGRFDSAGIQTILNQLKWTCLLVYTIQKANALSVVRWYMLELFQVFRVRMLLESLELMLALIYIYNNNNNIVVPGLGSGFG